MIEREKKVVFESWFESLTAEKSAKHFFFLSFSRHSFVFMLFGKWTHPFVPITQTARPIVLSFELRPTENHRYSDWNRTRAPIDRPRSQYCTMYMYLLECFARNWHASVLTDSQAPIKYMFNIIFTVANTFTMNCAWAQRYTLHYFTCSNGKSTRKRRNDGTSQIKFGNKRKKTYVGQRV